MGYQLTPKTASNGQIATLTDTVLVTTTKLHTDTVVARVKSRSQAVRVRAEQLDSVLQVTESVAPETAPESLTVLLDTLSKTARLYQFEVLRYQGLVDSLLLTHQAERGAMVKQAEALREALRGAEDRARCSTFGMPCPTRWQAFAIGVGVAATVLALR